MINHLLMHGLGAIHLTSAMIALIAGTCVLAMKKGTAAHRRFGRTCVAGMLATNASALGIYELFGRFGPFHVLALLSLLSVLAGLIPLLRRQPGWMERHARLMTGSYVGLCAAAVAEISSHLLNYPFGPTVIISSTAVIVIGVVWMRSNLSRRFTSSGPI